MPISGDSAATSAVRTILRPNPAAAHPPNPLFSPTIGPPNLFSHGGSELPRGKFASFDQSPLFYSTSSSEVVRKSGGGGGTEKSGGGRRRRGLTFTCWNRCGHTLGWPGSIGRSVLGCLLGRGCGQLLWLQALGDVIPFWLWCSFCEELDAQSTIFLTRILM